MSPSEVDGAAPAVRPALALMPAGAWAVQVGPGTVTVDGLAVSQPVILPIRPPEWAVVTGERYGSLPVFDPNPLAAGWMRGALLAGVSTQETSARYRLDPDSLRITAAADGGTTYELGRDYGADLEYGSFGRLEGGRIAAGQPVYAHYRYGLSRLDAIVRSADGALQVRAGRPHLHMPQPPQPAPGERVLAHVWLPGRLPRLGPEHLYPILEDRFPEPPRPTWDECARQLPRTTARLQKGGRLRILAWGDSVTEASYLPAPERWQAQFADRLGERFPQVSVEMLTEGWGGRNTTVYLAEPPGSEHNYAAKVLAARPDLIVSEFVNDAGLTPPEVEEQYGRLLADFQAIGAEWIILTPHYVRPDWMDLPHENWCDEDPRPYVAGLEEFSARHGTPLARSSRRWGRLWRQGLPYTTLFLNDINHPNARGMRLFADSLMALIPEE